MKNQQENPLLPDGMAPGGNLYASLVEQSNDAICLLMDDRFVFINQRFADLFGVSREEACRPDFDFMTLVAPESHPLIRERQDKIKKKNRCLPRMNSWPGPEITAGSSWKHPFPISPTPARPRPASRCVI